MIGWIAKDEDGNIVGKWKRHRKPKIKEDYEIMSVSDVSDYDIDYWYFEQS